MAQPITDYPAFFDGARQMVAEVESLRKEEEELKAAEAKTRAELAAEKKALQDAIDLTLKKRLSEINNTYDAEISKAKEALKKAKAKREHAKSIGVKERIKEETRDLLQENTELLREMKEVFRQAKVSGIFRSRLYYSLYFPHKVKDFFCLFIYMLIFFAAIPCAIYFLAIPEKFRMTPVLIVVFVISIFLFGGIYILIGNASRINHMDTMKTGRVFWDRYEDNEAAVKRITRQIMQDKNEDKYDLGAYDDEISHLEHSITDASGRKQEALSTFETVTKNIITDELTQNAKAKLDILNSDHEVAARRLKETGEARRQKTMLLSDNYEVYLGKEFLETSKLNALQEIMEKSTVANISEAIEEYRNSQDE